MSWDAKEGSNGVAERKAWEALLRWARSSKVYPRLKLKVNVDSLTFHVWGEGREGTMKSCKQFRKSGEQAQRCVNHKEKFKFSLTEGGKAGKSRLTASNQLLEAEIHSLCDAEGICLKDNVEYLGGDVRNQKN